MSDLNQRQLRFCREYVCDFNGARAARAAGYKAACARVTACQLLTNPNIRAEVDLLIQERTERTRVTADRVVLELALLGFSNIQDYTTDDSGLVTVVEDADPMASRAIASTRRKLRTRGRGAKATHEAETEIKLWDKVAALKLLALHTGVVEKRATLQGDPVRPISHEHDITLDIEQLPDKSALVGYLRDLGLPIPGDVPSDGRNESVDRRDGS